VADQKDIFIRVNQSFFFKKISYPLTCFLTCFAFWKAEVCRPLMKAFPNLGIFLLYFLVAQAFNATIVNFVQSFIND
jgi:hypothetical protein